MVALGLIDGIDNVINWAAIGSVIGLDISGGLATFKEINIVINNKKNIGNQFQKSINLLDALRITFNFISDEAVKRCAIEYLGIMFSKMYPLLDAMVGMIVVVVQKRRWMLRAVTANYLLECWCKALDNLKIGREI